MNAISKIALPELAPQSSARLTLTRPSGISPQDGMVCTLLMRQAAANYMRQEIPEETQEMYLAQWEEMVLRFGMQEFRDALSKAISSSEWFPSPIEILGHCEASARTKRERNETLRYMREMAATKAQCERERLEDEAKGPRERTDTEKRLDAILQAARVKDKQNAVLRSAAGDDDAGRDS